MYNKVILIGRLVAKPELNKTLTDKQVVRFTLAVNRRFKTTTGEREVDFINAVAWGGLAETLASYASKGSLLSLDGELRTRKYDKGGSDSFCDRGFVSFFSIAGKSSATSYT